MGNFFGYDKLDRLKADTSAIVTRDNCTWNPGAGWQCPPPTADSVHVYSYDGAGNRLDLGGSYGSANRITAFNSCTYGTDADGNVTSRTCGGTTVRFHWTAENLLKAVKVVGGDSIDFRYDATGRLVRRDVNSGVQAYFLWSGDDLFAELDPSGVDRVEYSYYPGMDRLHAVSAASDTVYFAHRDGLGNTVGLVNHQNNQLRGTYWYDRWGKWVSENENLGMGAPRNRSRFKGALWMGDLGPELYYMRNRWYEPQSGRFLSEDPTGLAGGINPYTFAASDPVGLSDPHGLAPRCEDAERIHDASCDSWEGGGFEGSATMCLMGGPCDDYLTTTLAGRARPGVEFERRFVAPERYQKLKFVLNFTDQHGHLVIFTLHDVLFDLVRVVRVTDRGIDAIYRIEHWVRQEANIDARLEWANRVPIRSTLIEVWPGVYQGGFTQNGPARGHWIHPRMP